MHWLLACSVAASVGNATAGPEDCLTLRHNTAVAGCANKYAPGTSGTSPQPTQHLTRPVRQPIQAVEQSLLFPIPVAAPRAVAVAATRESPDVIAEQDRFVLIRRSEVGAISLAAMGLEFGVWRWRASMVKTCSFCGIRVAPGAAVCKRCFRSV